MAAASESEAAIRAVTTATPSAPVPRKISKFSLFNPPIATTGIDTAFRISASVLRLCQHGLYLCRRRIHRAHSR